MKGQRTKENVLNQIANGQKIVKCPSSKWQIGDAILHVRYRTNPVPGGCQYSFNINPNTLKADYEVWICGSENRYYLIPISIIRKMYEHPNTYIDSRYQYRVASIDVNTHRCLYARGGCDKDFTDYFCSIIY